MDPLRASNKLRRLIRAYHGSPHSFSRFDASKIGTGEGAQSYGHGLYFAGNEAVARDYRDRLKDLVDGPVPDELGDELQGVIQEVRRLAKLRSAAKGDEWHAIDRALADLHVRHQDVQHRIREASYNPGHMYEVEIDYPEEALLDWDAPMSKQPAARQAISEIASHLPMEPPVESMLDMLALDRTGANLYSSLENSISENMDAWSMPDQIRRQRVGGEVSKALLERGVPGIRYLDQGSRAAGEGTRNYVMFPGTEDRIRILRKYGLLAPLGAGAMGGED